MLPGIIKNKDMKTLEEKAKQRAFEITSSLGLNIAELIVAINDVYIEAANEALQSQWRSSQTIGECKDRRVFTIYRTKYGGSWLTIKSVESPESWSSEDIHKKDDLIAWMPIPELPKDKRI